MSLKKSKETRPFSSFLGEESKESKESKKSKESKESSVSKKKELLESLQESEVQKKKAALLEAKLEFLTREKEGNLRLMKELAQQLADIAKEKEILKREQPL